MYLTSIPYYRDKAISVATAIGSLSFWICRRFAHEFPAIPRNECRLAVRAGLAKKRGLHDESRMHAAVLDAQFAWRIDGKDLSLSQKAFRGRINGFYVANLRNQRGAACELRDHSAACRLGPANFE
jgi:hypothetical protein